jgi:predicted transcriptional regulator
MSDDFESQKKTKLVTAWMPDDLVRQLDDISRRNDRSRGYTMRQLLQDSINRVGEQENTVRA